MKFFNKPIDLGIFAVALLAFSFSGAHAEASAVAARVNDTVITRAEVDEQVQQVMARMAMMVSPEYEDAIRKRVEDDVMERLITETLLRQRVKAEGIEVGDAEVEEFIAGLRTQLPPDTTMEQQLAAAGMSVEELRRQVKEDMAIQKLLESKIPGGLEPSDEEIVAFYNTNRDEFFTRPALATASHILVSTQDARSDEARRAAREKIDTIRAAILAGADFAEQAKAHSACPSGQQGGDLGQFPRGQMVPTFEDAAFTQEIGQVGPVVQTEFGLHLILVSDRTEGEVVALEEVRTDIAGHLENEKKQQAVEAYILKLREDATVEIVAAD